jgi:hypothetical protein
VRNLLRPSLGHLTHFEMCYSLLNTHYNRVQFVPPPPPAASRVSSREDDRKIFRKINRTNLKINRFYKNRLIFNFKMGEKISKFGKFSGIFLQKWWKSGNFREFTAKIGKIGQKKKKKFPKSFLTLSKTVLSSKQF